MKGFIATLFVVCGLIAAAYFLYDPYIKPLLEGGDKSMSDKSVEPVTPAPKAKPKQTAKAKPVQPPTENTKPAAPAVAEKSEIDLFLEERYPMPKIHPLEVIVSNWTAVPERAYPAQVTSSDAIAFDLIVDGQKIGSSNVAPGTPLKPVRLVGDQLTVGNAANPGMSKVISVDSTDFKSQIQQRYDEFVASRVTGIDTARKRAKQALEANPALLAKLTGTAAPEPGSPSDPKFGPVKNSLRNGDVASVKFEEAKEFTWLGTEEIGGEFAGTYDTVIVEFEGEGLFGTYVAVYKCLLKGGQVAGWIDPVTEDRI